MPHLLYWGFWGTNMLHMHSSSSPQNFLTCLSDSNPKVIYDLLLWDNVACLSKIILAFGIMQEWGKEIPFQHSISCPGNNFQSSTRKKRFVWNPQKSLWDLKGDANLKKLG